MGFILQRLHVFLSVASRCHIIQSGQGVCGTVTFYKLAYLETLRIMTCVLMSVIRVVKKEFRSRVHPIIASYLRDKNLDLEKLILCGWIDGIIQ